MELIMETKTVDFLREVFQDTVTQEETAETVVPDSYPDVGEILHTFASAVLRGKDCRGGEISISGGIQAGVLYGPEDHSCARVLHVYLPFTVKAQGEQLEDDTRLVVRCWVRSADARIVNSRKVMVRVGICCHIAGYQPALQEICTELPEEAADLQVWKDAYTVVRPLETVEKPFTMAEEAELPTGHAPMRELCSYQADVQVTDAKLVGTKGVFKGVIQLCLLYLTEEEEWVSWSCQLPFSQYVEFSQEYGDDEELQVEVALTDLNVEDANGQGKRLLINLQLLAQCTVVGQTQMEVIEDAYSLHHAFTPQWKELETGGRLDRQHMSATVRSAVQAPVKSVVDTKVYLGEPAVSREKEQVTIQLPMTANVLYLDENGELRGSMTHLEAECQTELAEHCLCRPSAVLSGEPFAVPSGEGMEVRCAVDFCVDSVSDQGIRTLCGGELEEAPPADGPRPSVVLRAMGPEETLWSLAKCCRTTTEAIRMANGLTEDAARPQGMLLIPIVP